MPDRSAPLPGFTLFPKLPAELRNLIWKHSLHARAVMVKYLKEECQLVASQLVQLICLCRIPNPSTEALCPSFPAPNIPRRSQRFTSTSHKTSSLSTSPTLGLHGMNGWTLCLDQTCSASKSCHSPYTTTLFEMISPHTGRYSPYQGNDEQTPSLFPTPFLQIELTVPTKKGTIRMLR